MIPEFEKMIFDLNEGINHIGLFPDGKYISGFDFIMSVAVSMILTIAFIKIVIWSDWYEEHKKIFQAISTLIVIAEVVVIFFIAIYYMSHGEILFLTAGVVVVLIVANRKEFTGLRRFLDEQFGWLF